MPDNPIDPSIDPQTPGEHRVVWRKGTPLMAETDDDGVVHLYPIAIVPDACWDMPYGRLCALPYWANNINDPAEQMGVLVAILGSKQLEAIDALEAIRLHVSATRILIGGGVSQDLIAERLAKLYENIKAVLGTLDP